MRSSYFIAGFQHISNRTTTKAVGQGNTRRRSNVKVACELFLLAISQNIRKAIVKCDTGRLENHILHPASLLNFCIS
ncbi:MAG: hypothetical protein Q4E72_04965 [bacterium]|nr:hypothetical protein [bacterium]